MDDSKIKGYAWKQLLTGFTVLLIAFAAGLCVYIKHNKIQNITVEVGQAVRITDLWTGIGRAEWSAGYPAADTAKIGEYQSEIIVAGIYRYPVTIQVVDTVAPEFETKDIELNYGYICSLEEFVVSGNDATEITYQYEEEPDFMNPGVQTVTIIATDEAGNQTSKDAQLIIGNVKEEVIYEYGIGIPRVDVFLVSPDPEARYVSVPSYLEGILPGEYGVIIASNGRTYAANLILQDTIAPRAEAIDVQGWMNEPLNPEDFVNNLWDASEVTIEYEQEPDWTWANRQAVTIRLTDASGNVGYVESGLSLINDNEPPVINGSSINVTVGTNVSYRRSITVSDNHDAPEDITLEINADGVDLSTVGDYTVSYTATDRAGNQSMQEVVVHVNPVQIITYDLNTINQLADEVLAQIITPDMTQEQKAYAIYWWAHNQITYINHTDKGDWLRAAYEAFTLHRGDCYAYACACQALLTRVGIENVMIHKEQTPATTQSNHFWNLVNLGNGWYHFDTTPRRDGTTFYMATDAYIQAYSDSHRGSHNFTRENYPPIN